MTRLFILIVVFFIACSPRQYEVTSAFRNGVPAGTDYIQLDSSYSFYLREMYKDENPVLGNVMKANLRPADTIDRKRIEVEFLLVSWEHGSALYFTCVPDKYQQYYSTFKLASPSYINAYDFSRFHFGRFNEVGDQIEFVSKDGLEKDTWEIRQHSSAGLLSLSIKSIIERNHGVTENVILVSDALEQPVKFDRIDSFAIVFRKFNRKLEKRGRPPDPRRLVANRIYFVPEKKGYGVYFHFDKYITGYKDSTIRFEDKRIRYTPVPLFSGKE
jgi:hypothetical protein